MEYQDARRQDLFAQIAKEIQVHENGTGTHRGCVPGRDPIREGSVRLARCSTAGLVLTPLLIALMNLGCAAESPRALDDLSDGTPGGETDASVPVDEDAAPDVAPEPLDDGGTIEPQDGGMSDDDPPRRGDAAPPPDIDPEEPDDDQLSPLSASVRSSCGEPLGDVYRYEAQSGDHLEIAVDTVNDTAADLHFILATDSIPLDSGESILIGRDDDMPCSYSPPCDLANLCPAVEATVGSSGTRYFWVGRTYNTTCCGHPDRVDYRLEVRANGEHVRLVEVADDVAPFSEMD